MLIYQPADGYRYNSDSIFLYDFISSIEPKGEMLDVGCGAGIISALLARDFDVNVTAIDIQQSMIEYARYNYSSNGLDIETCLCDISEYKSDKKYDYVVSNPPFYDSSVIQSDNKSINTARYTHNMPLDVLIKSVKKLLKSRGYFVLCYDAKQTDLLLCELRSNGINPEMMRFVHSKIDRDAKLVMVTSRVSSKSMLKILPPLVVFDEDDTYTDEARVALESAKTETKNVKSIPI